MTTELVKEILSQYRALQGEFDMRITLFPGSELDEEALILNRKLAVIEAWLRLLTEEEYFVVIKHFVDQLPWPLLAVEYEKQWGSSQARHMRTLKRFQAKALEKMAAGIEKWKMASEVEKLFKFNHNGKDKNHEH
jgi:hypothetical protein